MFMKYGRPTNPAGIDLSDQVFRDLGMRNNGWWTGDLHRAKDRMSIHMHKAYVLTIAAVCLFANCNDKRVAAQSVRHEEQHTGAPTKIIEIPVNMKEEREI